MITRQCCAGGSASRRSARRLSTIAASILPGAVLALLPKCPLCLAAWLTVVTGVGFSASGAAWTRGMLITFWIAAATLAGLLTGGVRFRERFKWGKANRKHGSAAPERWTGSNSPC